MHFVQLRLIQFWASGAVWAVIQSCKINWPGCPAWFAKKYSTRLLLLIWRSAFTFVFLSTNEILYTVAHASKHHQLNLQLSTFSQQPICWDTFLCLGDTRSLIVVVDTEILLVDEDNFFTSFTLRLLHVFIAPNSLVWRPRSRRVWIRIFA